VSDTATTGREEQRTQLLAAVGAIEATLREVADQAERDRRYPEAGWRALHEAGLFRLKAPRELGGHEADPVTQIDVIERLAYIDTTAGWTQFVGAGTLAIPSAWLPEEGIADFMVDGRLPRTAGGIAANGTAVRVDGGYRLTGRWPFGSGVYHSEWLSGQAYIADSDPMQVKGFAFRVEQATIHDTWDVNALKGTGSADIEVKDLFVPDKHVFDNFGPAPRGGPLYQIALPGLVANEHGAFVLGAARRAMDETAELAKTKTRGFVVPQGVAAREKFQWDLGRADVALRAARAGLVEVNEEAWQAAVAGTPIDAELQTRMRAAAVYATEISLEVARTMFRYAGAKSLYVGNVIERCLRDIQAAAQHGIVNDVSHELHGQTMLGLQEVAPIS
jgi:alkylation response protein AidB-like acyl-CoA dehydrogenase